MHHEAITFCGKIWAHSRACLLNSKQTLIQLNVYQQPANLLKLRNPWSNREWTGRASELDTQFWSRVSPADKQLMGFKQANDGIFYILW